MISLSQQLTKRFLKLLIVFSALLLSSASFVTLADDHLDFTAEERQFIEDHPVIIVGGEQDWPPFDFVENGQYTGAAKDYLAVLSKYTGLNFEVKTGMTWDELLDSLKTKKIDLLPMIYWSLSRTDYMNFTEPYLTIRQYLFIHKDSHHIHSLGDMENKVLAVPKGYAQIELLAESYPKIKILEVASPIDAIDAVITKQADGLIENTALVNYHLKQNNIKGIKPALPTNLGIHKLYMASRKDWPILRDIIQKGLNAMTRHEHDVIARQWLEYEPESKQQVSQLKKLALTEQQHTYLQDKKVLKACIDPDWMPYEGIQDGQHVGMSADYVKLFQQRINTPIEIVTTESWQQSIQYAKSRACDILMLSMDTPERRQYMDLTTPYLTLPVVLATKSDVLFITDLNDLNKYKIGIFKRHALADIMMERYPGIDFIFVESMQEGLDKVERGELFGLIGTLSSLGYDIQKEHVGQLKIGGKFGFDWQVSVATRNDEPALGQIFEQIVLDLSQQEKQAVLNNWVSIEFVEGFDYEAFWQVVIAFSAILLLTFFRNRQLVNHRGEIYQKNKELAAINSQLQLQKNEIQHLADHDFLTGLPNRKSFSNLLSHAISIAKRKRYSVAVLFLDLDRFKTINDSFGHHVGDEMLKTLSKRLKETLRDSDTIARIGGDEFLIILEAVDDYHYPGIVAQKILKTIREPLTIADHVINNSASIGIALFPEDGKDANTLIKNADSAMYLAKEKGKDNYQYYTYELSVQMERDLFIESALKDAVKNNQLSLLYQPQIDLQTMEMIGVEVLLRWHHPNLGQVSPAEFIPIAEDSGLIVEIGEWIFNTACAQFAQWKSDGHQLDSLAINVSSVQFTRNNLAETFTNIVNQYNIEPKHIEIEITERYVMAHTEQNDLVLNSLRDNGFRISVDDFGTGYSSMSYLKTLPLDIIKIDKSFIDEIPHDNNDVQITKAILALSHSLGYTVIAEGIEKQEQLEMLQGLSCEIGQGYYFSKPLPADELLQLLLDNKNGSN